MQFLLLLLSFSGVLSKSPVMFSTNNICISMVRIIVVPSCMAFFAFLGSGKLSNLTLNEQFSSFNLCLGNAILSLTH